ncbi:MAG: response regulator transcription factor [Acidobacteriota bacterium]
MKPEPVPSRSTRRRAVREVVLYGAAGGVSIAVLKLVEARFFVSEGSFAVYGGLIALLFAGLGIWLGASLRREEVAGPSGRVTGEAAGTERFVRDEERLAHLGLTPRELEILELIAAGLSNREIAARLFVSENTVKTHASRVFGKLGAKRRTQAVQIAQESRLIP